jgi:hypothetical protein
MSTRNIRNDLHGMTASSHRMHNENTANAIHDPVEEPLLRIGSFPDDWQTTANSMQNVQNGSKMIENRVVSR